MSLSQLLPSGEVASHRLPPPHVVSCLCLRVLPRNVLKLFCLLFPLLLCGMSRSSQVILVKLIQTPLKNVYFLLIYLHISTFTASSLHILTSEIKELRKNLSLGLYGRRRALLCVLEGNGLICLLFEPSCEDEMKGCVLSLFTSS